MYGGRRIRAALTVFAAKDGTWKTIHVCAWEPSGDLRELPTPADSTDAHPRTGALPPDRAPRRHREGGPERDRTPNGSPSAFSTRGDPRPAPEVSHVW